ncbi:hypothetical protein H9Y04_17605 [Streptomyces sp. TRM66268-LWL]|uniref:Uncharacterized protein n=1 Tax=Streptomyces polyasparticus TaxID=2767826 RepID=A0ABR7SG56_9ACTN|nr:hypothetical protein [Streptomyces polyasparticus]MBC9714378.1 hypothetical protein [Streptomyces polyasparticus]
MNVCRVCSVGEVSPFRLVSDGRRLWVCHECDAVWFGDALPVGSADGRLYQYVERYRGPGTPTDWEQIEPVAE